MSLQSEALVLLNTSAHLPLCSQLKKKGEKLRYKVRIGTICLHKS